MSERASFKKRAVIETPDPFVFVPYCTAPFISLTSAVRGLVQRVVPRYVTLFWRAPPASRFLALALARSRSLASAPYPCGFLLLSTSLGSIPLFSTHLCLTWCGTVICWLLLRCFSSLSHCSTPSFCLWLFSSGLGSLRIIVAFRRIISLHTFEWLCSTHQF